MSQLVSYSRDLFIWRPAKPSKASEGHCSWCWRERPATFAVLTNDNRARWAVCRLHAKLFSLNRERETVRAMFDLDIDDSTELRLLRS